GKSIEVARHRVGARPAGDAQLDCERARAIRRDGDFHAAIPGVARVLNELHMTLLVRFEIRVPARVQVDVDGVTLPRVHVTGHGGQKAGDVAGATGHAEPGTALVLAVRLERVRIEESLAV